MKNHQKHHHTKTLVFSILSEKKQPKMPVKYALSAYYQKTHQKMIAFAIGKMYLLSDIRPPKSVLLRKNLAHLSMGKNPPKSDF
jgi:hypothetical protein